MKILIVNTYDRGGAANACLRLHEGLLQEGIDSKVLLKFRKKQLPETYRFKHTLKPKGKLVKAYHKFSDMLTRKNNTKKAQIETNKSFLKKRATDLELFSFPQSNDDITKSSLYKEADIINLHWVADFLDYESFFKKNKKPVVWTLHDMNPFSGGEHYEGLFSGIDGSGFPIQRVIPEDEVGYIKKNLSLKQKLLDEITNLTIVAPSQWLAEEARRSQAFHDKPVYCIPYGINCNAFKPHDKITSRLQFNIPINKKVILFVADSVHNQRKGFEYLIKALKKINNKDFILCSIGSNDDNLTTFDNLLPLGIIKTEHLMSMAYSAADVFVIPSLMDNLPNTVIESLLCGTPVIGFPVGGIPDMILQGKNGILTKEVSVNSLFDTLTDFLDSDSLFDRNSIREEAVEKYSLSIQAKRYQDIFEKII